MFEFLQRHLQRQLQNRIVYEAASKNLVPVTLELGGKSPVIVTFLFTKI
jgi:hypothetical protein